MVYDKIDRFVLFVFLLLSFTFVINNVYGQNIDNKTLINSAGKDNTAVSTHSPLVTNSSSSEIPYTCFLPEEGIFDRRPTREITDLQRKSIEYTISEMPISFRKNMGQWDDKIIYRGSSPGWKANINFMKNGLSFGFSRNKESVDFKEAIPGQEEREYMVWNLNFKGANPGTYLTAEGKEDSHTNYMLALNNVKENVPDYRMIKYNEVYKNIDLRYYRDFL